MDSAGEASDPSADRRVSLHTGQAPRRRSSPATAPVVVGLSVRDAVRPRRSYSGFSEDVPDGAGAGAGADAVGAARRSPQGASFPTRAPPQVVISMDAGDRAPASLPVCGAMGLLPASNALTRRLDSRDGDMSERPQQRPRGSSPVRINVVSV